MSWNPKAGILSADVGSGHCSTELPCKPGGWTQISLKEMYTLVRTATLGTGEEAMVSSGLLRNSFFSSIHKFSEDRKLLFLLHSLLWFGEMKPGKPLELDSSRFKFSPSLFLAHEFLPIYMGSYYDTNFLPQGCCKGTVRWCSVKHLVGLLKGFPFCHLCHVIKLLWKLNDCKPFAS